MSADNWDQCPRCRNKANVAKDEQCTALAEAYGKVDADEYVRLRVEAEKPVEIEPTLREDYSIGIDNDMLEFYVEYKANCAVCKFTFTYSFDKDVKI